MRKKLLSGMILALLLLGSLTSAFNIQQVKAESNTWIVDDDGPADFSTIQEAINAANSGDTIIVRDGTYTENVKVNKDHLTIKSENGAEATIVQAANPDYNIFQVTASYVTISGFTVIGGDGIGDGVFVYKSTDVRVANCIVKGCEYGITVGESTSILIENNVAQENKYNGIDFFDSSNIIAKSNNCSLNNYAGFQITRTSGKIIQNNIKNNKWGISLYQASSNIILENDCISNTYGIQLDQSNNNRIYLNNFRNNEINILSFNSANFWNSPEEITYTYNGKTYTNYLGNYWSDYTGSDADGDGIGDTPHSIDGDKDNYPLMEPFENYAFGAPRWSFAIITDLHVGRGYPDYGPKGYEEYKELDDLQILSLCQDYYLTERLNNVVEEIRRLRTKYNIKFVVVLGDISDSGEYSELLKAKSILDKLNVDTDGDGKYEMVYIPVIGNHDVWPKIRDDKGNEIKAEQSSNFFYDVFHLQFSLIKNNFTETFQGPDGVVHMNYNFTIGLVKFVCLDFTDKAEGTAKAVLHGETLKWLSGSLKANEPTIIFSHHPLIGDSELELVFTRDVWKWVMAELGAFEDDDIKTLSELIKDSKAKILANFAGHVHGFYDEYKIFSPFLKYYNPIFWNANRIYEESALGDVPIFTTEALMVGSNEPTPKAVIRIVKMRGEIIENSNIFEGEVYVRAVNPYLRVKPREINWWDYIPFLGEFWNELKQGKVPVNFEAYAFTKRASADYPIHYNLEFGDGSSTGVWISDWDKQWKLPKPHFYDGTPGKSYDITLTVTGFTPEGEKIIEALKQKVTPSQWVAVGVSSPVDIVLKDPDGFIISKELNEVAGAAYLEYDFNGDDHLEDLIVVPDRKTGDYLISVNPESGASPEETYTLWISMAGSTFTLAENVQICNIPINPYIVRSTETRVIPIIPATVDFDPDTLNLKSKGKWVTVYIELPVGHGYNVSMINITSVSLNGQILAETRPIEIGDYDGDGIPDLMVKFDRIAVRSILEVGEEVEITISGALIDGRLFEGKDVIRVISE